MFFLYLFLLLCLGIRRLESQPLFLSGNPRNLSRQSPFTTPVFGAMVPDFFFIPSPSFLSVTHTKVTQQHLPSPSIPSSTSTPKLHRLLTRLRLPSPSISRSLTYCSCPHDWCSPYRDSSVLLYGHTGSNPYFGSPSRLRISSVVLRGLQLGSPP